MIKYTPEIVDQLKDLLNIGIALSAEKNHDRLMEMIVAEARRITNADGGTLYLCANDHLFFKIIQTASQGVFRGGNGEPVNLPPVPMKRENVSSYVALTRKSVNIPDVYVAEGFDFSGPKAYDKITGYRTCSMLVIPLQNHEEEVIGVLQLLNAQDESGNTVSFPPHIEKVIFSLASQAAIALTNMYLLEDIEHLFNSFVEVMATAIDSRTPYNAHHTRRVALLAGELARAIDKATYGKWSSASFNEDRLAQLVMAGWLHDIGKISTPLQVMNKATRIESKFDLIMQRFDYILSSIKNEYLERKLQYTAENDQNALHRLENWWAAEAANLEEARILIVKVDNPATFVDQSTITKLNDIGRKTYIDSQGNEHPWLNPDELSALSVTKGTLTEQERKIMEDHVEVTHRMLEKIPFTKKLQAVPYLAHIHHEQLNGSGYPQGLKGDEIPLEGRILALVDVFDALTAADRPYKKAMPVDQAIKILGFMVKDQQLDGDLLEIFINDKVWEKVI